MVFNGTFQQYFTYIMVVSFIVVEETGVLGENYQSTASHWQNLSYNAMSGTQTHNFIGDRHWLQIQLRFVPYGHDPDDPSWRFMSFSLEEWHDINR